MKNKNMFALFCLVFFVLSIINASAFRSPIELKVDINDKNNLIEITTEIKTLKTVDEKIVFNVDAPKELKIISGKTWEGEVSKKQSIKTTLKPTIDGEFIITIFAKTTGDSWFGDTEEIKIKVENGKFSIIKKNTEKVERTYTKPATKIVDEVIPPKVKTTRGPPEVDISDVTFREKPGKNGSETPTTTEQGFDEDMSALVFSEGIISGNVVSALSKIVSTDTLVQKTSTTNFAGTVTVIGCLFFKDYYGAWQPAKWIMAYAYDEDLGPDDYLGQDMTDNNGCYVLGPYSNTDIVGTLDIYVKFWAGNGAFEMQDDNIITSVYDAYSLTYSDVSDGTLNIGNLGVSSSENDAWLALDALNDGWDFLSDNGYSAPQVISHWPDKSWGIFTNQYGAYYIVGGDMYFGLDAAQSKDIVIHEYGHFIMYKAYGNYFPPSDCPSPHYIDSVSGINCAWGEGWANFFPLAVFDERYLTYHGHYDLNMEATNPVWSDGDMVEGRVASALYDIYDSVNDGFDSFSDGFSNIWDTFYNQNDNTFYQFWTAWVSRGHNEAKGLDALFQNTINYFSTGDPCSLDTQCPSNYCEGSASNIKRCCSSSPPADGWVGGGNSGGCSYSDPTSYYRDYYCTSGGGSTYETTTSKDCDSQDGWYSTGDSGPGCNQMNDPTATDRDYYVITNTNTCTYSSCGTNDCDLQDGWYGGGNTQVATCGSQDNDATSYRRDYYVSSGGSCTYTTSNCGTNDCDSQDGWYGGGNNAGCGNDPSSTYRDYYSNVNANTCTYTTSCSGTSTFDCDSNDLCSNQCNGDDVRSYKDYYVVSNTNSCAYSWGSLIQTCGSGCSGGSCIGICNFNSDCGTDEWLNAQYCNGDNVWDTWRTWICTVPGTSSCTFSDNAQLREVCADTCSGGSCVTIACSVAGDCGIDGWVGAPSCSGNDVYQDWRAYTCINAGLPSSSCTFSEASIFKETCSDTCSGGICVTSGPIYCDISPCIVGSDQIKSRDNVVGMTEPNSPNTIDACTDGSSGTYLIDESIEDITITSLVGTNFTTGELVNVEMTVYCYSSTNDYLNFVYANDSSSPGWRVIDSIVCPGTGIQQISKNILLDDVEGDHAIRGAFRYVGSPTTTCAGGPYDDNDDVVIKVVNAPLLPGKLESYLVDPLSNIEVVKDNFFTFTSGVECIGGECGDVSVVLDPPASLNLTTTIAGGNSQNGNMFNLHAEKNIIIKRFSTHWQTGSGTARIYWHAGGLVLTDDGGWNLVGTAPYNAVAGTFFELPIDVNLTINAGETYGFYITNTGGVDSNIIYTNGDIAVYSNSDITLSGSYGIAYPFSTSFNPRSFNGIIWYEAIGGKGAIPMNTGTPFYTTDQNPTTCFNMQDGDTCEITWSVNATGAVDSEWKFFVIYNSVTYPAQIEENRTEIVNVTIKNDGGDGYLWSSDTGTDTIYKLSKTGTTIDSFAAPAGASGGLAWDGTYLWSADVSADTIYKLTVNGDVVESFPSPSSTPYGMTWGGTNLWVAEFSTNTIYEVTTSGVVVDSFSGPGIAPTGLAWDGTYLWVADYTTDIIYKITTGGSILNSFSSSGSGPLDLAWDGTYLWNNDLTDGKVYKITTSGTDISNFNTPGSGVRGLAWVSADNIACSANNDCGADGWVYALTCNGDDVWQDWRTYNCANAGLVSSYCDFTDNSQLKQACAGTCSSGSCVAVACTVNSDCGADGWVGAPSCTGNDVYQDWRMYICTDGGLPSASCSSSDSSQLKEICADTCLGGSCVSIACYNNSDCGADGWVGAPSCTGNDVYQDWRIYNCINDGLPSSSCSSVDNSQLKETCADTCSGGSCAAIACTVNSDCGADGWVDSPSCSGNSLYQDYRTFTCINPGLGSSCSNSINSQLKETCTFGCSGGSCIGCTSHDHYSCFSDDVYWYDSCNVLEDKKQECGIDSCNSWGSNYCKTGDVYHSRTCYNKGCSVSNCYSVPSIEEEKVQECGTDPCSGGICVCQPEYSCTAWQPSVCPIVMNGIYFNEQARTCTDTKCGTGSYNEKRTC